MTPSLTTIQVASGRLVDPINPRVEDIDIEDIAHSLANQCRFAGHTRKFYSVAEHAVRTSLIVPDEDKFWALNHDDSEAYLVDVPSPLKYALFGEQYRAVEEKLMSVITEKFRLEPEMPESVKYADARMLSTEARDLLVHGDNFTSLREPWLTVPALETRITPWTSERAKTEFLTYFHYYNEGNWNVRTS